MTTRFVALPFTAMLVLALAACATSPGTDGVPSSAPSTSSTASKAPSLNPDVAMGTDPDLVVDQVAATYWASDTSTDTTPLDAARRAGQWLTTAHRELIAEDLPSGPGADWLTLAEHQGKYIVTSTDATDAMELPPETPTSTSRGRVLELTPVGTDGWTGTKTTLVVQFDLTRSSAGDPWAVDVLTASEPIGMPADPSHEGH